jgi:Lrp/AsnC family leucine-responsive transcriptional regulator
MEAYRRILGERIAALPGVEQTHTYFVMEEVKSTHAFALPVESTGPARTAQVRKT